MLQIGYVLAVCVLVLLKVSCVTNTSIEASDTHQKGIQDNLLHVSRCMRTIHTHTACLTLTRSLFFEPAVNIQGYIF